jgi:hypothetical protein
MLLPVPVVTASKPRRPRGELASDLRHKNGEWSTEATNFDTLSNLDCAKVASIQAGVRNPIRAVHRLIPAL